MRRAPRPPAPTFVLAQATREPVDGDAISYSAYFASVLQPTDEVVTRIRAFAETHGARAVLEHDGRPFAGMVCCVRLEPLTKAAVHRFRAEFSPGMDSPIDILT